MKKNKNKLFIKLGILFSFLAIIFSFAIPTTYAYTLEENGTIKSDNLLDINNYFSKTDTVNVENDTLVFNALSPIVMQFYNSSMGFVSEFLPITSVGRKWATFTMQSNYKYLRIKSNYDNREVLYSIDYLSVNNSYTISCLCSDYDTNPKLSYIMLNSGSTALQYEPYGVWYPNGSMPSELYSAFNGCTVELYDYYTNTLLYTQSLENLVASSTAITNDNLSILYDYALERYNNASLNENKDIYYLVFNLNSYLNASLLFRYNNNFVDKKVILNDTLNNLNYEYLSDVGDYNLVVNSEYNSFNQIVYYSWYFSDYASLYLSLSTDGYSYSQGYNEAKDKYEILVDTLDKQYDNLEKRYEILNNMYLDLQNSFEQSGIGWQGLFFAMADTPFKTVQNMLGFEVLGVNLFGVFVGFITVLAIIWILKKFLK